MTVPRITMDGVFSAGAFLTSDRLPLSIIAWAADLLSTAASPPICSATCRGVMAALSLHTAVIFQLDLQRAFLQFSTHAEEVVVWALQKMSQCGVGDREWVMVPQVGYGSRFKVRRSAHLRAVHQPPVSLVIILSSVFLKARGRRRAVLVLKTNLF